MVRVRTAVVDQLGYTTSAGIASNKTLAKLCSSWRKPNSQTTMRPAAVANFLRDLPFQKIRFLGGKLGNAISTEWESSTVGDLWSISREEMQARFGEESLWVFNVLRGIDHSEVKERVATKSMLASKNVRPPIRKTADAMHWLSILSTELAIRLREAREDMPNLWPRTLIFRFLRAGDVPRSKQVAFPFVRDLQGHDILKAAKKLWNESAGDALGTPEGSIRPAEIVSISLAFSQLEAGETGQKSIQGFFRKREASTPVFVEGSTKAKESDGNDEASIMLFGISCDEVRPVRSEHKKRKEPGGLELFAKKQKLQLRDHVADAHGEGEGKGSDELTWTCDECGKVVRQAFDASAADDNLRCFAEQTLVLQKQDHQDWHFAVALSREELAASSNPQQQHPGHHSCSSDPSLSVSSTTSKKKKKGSAPSDAKQKKEGITSFFSKKS
ncbi:DNA/RNA polymerase [Tilletiaria anomala UBC 951]|uniref:DNA polymerase eta n=1 Tax=Tilletiaria anomala (strain ATCC 24038 / CBS 436.72 / UBC 951) TaxID=1037660 RepID=A0A066V7T2_TILAU|nr:DNA/RNA polymerase [Tilletiaria anomala UBC 951]KDN34789.1 DNA/RNA polymerase [Tilletiaria anomala UBC 951]